MYRFRFIKCDLFYDPVEINEDLWFMTIYKLFFVVIGEKWHEVVLVTLFLKIYKNCNNSFK